MKPLIMALKRQRIETLDGNVNETQENAPNQEVKGGGKKGASRRKDPANGCWECSGDHYASECPNVSFPRTQWNTIKPVLNPQDGWGRMYEPIRQSWKEKGKGKSAGSPKGSGKWKGGKRRDHQQISMVMPDWMSFPPLNALTAQETGDWRDDQPLPQGYMMFLTKSDARKSPSEVVAEDGFKPVFLKRRANRFTRNTCFDHELHCATTYESSNRFEAFSEEHVEFESVEQDVVYSGADRGERDLPRRTTRIRVKEDFRKVLRVCQIETTN